MLASGKTAQDSTHGSLFLTGTGYPYSHTVAKGPTGWEVVHGDLFAVALDAGWADYHLSWGHVEGLAGHLVLLFDLIEQE